MDYKHNFIQLVSSRFSDLENLFFVEVSGDESCAYFEKRGCLKVPADYIGFILKQETFIHKEQEDKETKFNYYSVISKYEFSQDKKYIESCIFLMDSKDIFNDYLEAKKQKEVETVLDLMEEVTGNRTMNVDKIEHDKLKNIAVEIVKRFVSQESYFKNNEKRFSPEVYDFFNRVYEKFKRQYAGFNKRDDLFGPYRDLKEMIHSIDRIAVFRTSVHTAEYYIRSFLMERPELFKNKFDVLCYILLRDVPCFDWINGDLTDMNFPYFMYNELTAAVNNVMSKSVSSYDFFEIIKKHKKKHKKIDEGLLCDELAEYMNEFIGNLQTRVNRCLPGWLKHSVNDMTYTGIKLDNVVYKLGYNSNLIRVPKNVTRDWKLMIRDIQQ